MTLLFPLAAKVDGGMYTVKHYNLKERVNSLSEAEYAFANNTAWRGTPIIETYETIAFIHYLDANRNPHFKGSMVHFPGVPANSHATNEYFVLEATGTVHIPEAGWWTFACGSDDGIKLTISGHGINDVFPANGGAFATALRPINFPQAGKYSLQLFYFNVCAEAALELSLAKGKYSVFSSSAFNLVRASSEEEWMDITFHANEGMGNMDAKTVLSGSKYALPANTFTRKGYLFQG